MHPGMKSNGAADLVVYFRQDLLGELPTAHAPDAGFFRPSPGGREAGGSPRLPQICQSHAHAPRPLAGASIESGPNPVRLTRSHPHWTAHLAYSCLRTPFSAIHLQGPTP